jgi:type II secretory pathway pseudopilin PulG
VLGFLAAALFGWWLGSRADSRRADAAQSIWKEIYDAARSAMASNDNALKGRAEHLRNVVRERLTNTLNLTEGLSEGFGDLENAIAGKGPGHPGSHHDHGAGKALGQDDGHGPDHGRGETVHAGGGGGGAATANITIVTGAPAETSHTPGGLAPGHEPHATRLLTHREQTDALRLAVARFAEHWRDEPARIREMRGAHAELSNPGAARPARPPASGSRAAH